MSQIHPTAIIHHNAKIGENCNIGPYCTVGEQVTLHNNVTLISLSNYRGSLNDDDDRQNTNAIANSGLERV